MMEFNKAKWSLALIWFITCGLLLLVVFLQTILNKYGSRSDEVWNWLLPNIMPILTMMVGVIVADSRAIAANRTVGMPFVLFACGISGFYLLLICLIVFAGPLIQWVTGQLIFDVIDKTGVLLGPLQGVAASAVGILFMKKTEEAGSEDKEDKAPAAGAEPAAAE